MRVGEIIFLGQEFLQRRDRGLEILLVNVAPRFVQ